jgi:hypothetical protein
MTSLRRKRLATSMRDHRLCQLENILDNQDFESKKS